MKTWIVFFFVCCGCLLCWNTSNTQTFSNDIQLYRVLVVVADQWKDTNSRLIDETFAQQDMHDVVSLLTAWSVPYDILRLDEQPLQINRFLDGLGQKYYGCVIWMADPEILGEKNYDVLTTVVREYGTSLLVLSNRLRTPVLEQLIGVQYIDNRNTSYWNERNRLRMLRKHFITAGMMKEKLPDKVIPYRASFDRIIQAGVTTAIPLMELGQMPQLTVRDISPVTKVVWLGGPVNSLRKYPLFQKLFQRSLAYCLGYLIYKDYTKSYIFIMDDMGCSDHAYLELWSYPTPSREIIYERMIKPLQRRNAYIVQNICTGFYDPVKKMIVEPWTQVFTDPFGNYQDYASTKAGLVEGYELGLWEFQLHRAWTHLNYDLESPPGPYWQGGITGEMSEVTWSTELYDNRRGKPVPASVQSFLIERGRDAMRKSFGVEPLGVAIYRSADWETHTAPVAARLGFGIGRGYYKSSNLWILNHRYAVEASIGFPAHRFIHDLDLTVSENRFQEVLDEIGPDVVYMGFNELSAYTHAEIQTAAVSDFQIDITYDDHYCQWFKTRPSYWKMMITDDCIQQIADEQTITIMIDSEVKRVLQRNQAVKNVIDIELSKGIGKHSVQLK